MQTSQKTTDTHNYKVQQHQHHEKGHCAMKENNSMGQSQD